MFGPLVMSPLLPERTSLQQAQGAARPVHAWPGEASAEMAGYFEQLLDRVLRIARIGDPRALSGQNPSMSNSDFAPNQAPGDFISTNAFANRND
jgi:hypothetical protein